MNDLNVQKYLGAKGKPFATAAFFVDNDCLPMLSSGL